MAVSKIGAESSGNDDNAAHRVFPVTAKLTQAERKAVTEFAQSQGVARGQWMRDVLLRALHQSSTVSPSLAEVLGIRLLLVNVLRPLAAGQKMTPEAFDKLLENISTAKYELAGKLAAEIKE